jgi:hypothetical protein
MTVIDQILNEWAFRCHDGIVDMNNPEKVKILNEILEKYNLVEQEEEQSIDDKINTILSSLKDDEKEKIYQVLKKTKDKIRKTKDGKDIEENIKDKLLEKQIPENLAEYIVLKAEKKDQIDELDNLINSTSLRELREKEEKNLTKEAGNLDWINNITATQGSLSIGKGELLLTILMDNALLVSKKGVDIEVTGRDVEIKQSSETGGAIISQSGRSESYKQMWDEKIFDNGNKSFKEKWLQGIKTKISTWTPIYERFKLIENKVDYIKDLNTLIKKYGFDEEGLSTQDFNSIKQLCKKIAYLAVGEYLNKKDLILMNNNLDYVIITDKNQILDNSNIYTNSAFIPRISYKEPLDLNEQNKIIEEITDDSISELMGSDHFQLRVSERGNVLDVLNLNDVPLKNYKFTEVKEKLKTNISDELKERAEKILGKDIPSSTTYDVGIKILKPILVVDGEEHPLKLYAKSTKQVKNEKDEVIGIREIDNIGTLYFAVVADNTVTTLLLLNKEDDNDLYFQIKDHINRKKGGDKEAKILTPPNHVYKIDLDELMGKEKEKQSVELIDPQTLPYKIRTDYRVGANFDHEKFKTGKIVATSAGSGGKGDSRGMVDWIDVKYPELFLRGGKLTDTRRFERILTLASSLIKK